MFNNKHVLMDELKEGTDGGGGEDFSLDTTLADTLSKISVEDRAEVDETTGQPKEPAPAAPVVRNPPKAWKPEMHPHWGKLDPAVQEYLEARENEVSSGFEKHSQAAAYGRQMYEVVSPFMPDIQASGVTPQVAVQTLLSAHRALRTGSAEQKVQMFAKLAKDYGVDLSKVGVDEAPYVDPMLAAVTARLEKVEGAYTAEQKARLDALRSSTDKEVADFFADKAAHPFAEEVADQIVLLLQDPKISLQQAYEMAVFANPASRAKEMERLNKEAEAKLKAEKEKEAEEARKKRGTRVRGEHEGKPAGGDFLGTLDDTLSETLNTIKSRS